ncbi:MAG: molybdopterin converting factor subunit 1 [Alphaproteobacteria bacterium]|nr:molybdopterin converting factor subunit 1 [Alphaproteobacteria bacterium]
MKILYFSSVREAIGLAEEEVEVPGHVRTAGDLARWLSGRSEGHARAFADLAHVRAAFDMALCEMDTPLGTAREAAFFPPMTGG